MITRLHAGLLQLRRLLSPSGWLAKLLGLPVSQGAATRPGLILIQIDGLSKPEFERAIEKGELPFLRRLIRAEHYLLHNLYSGVPSTTPAFQAELFYGVKTAVPAFSFRQRSSGRIVRMYEQQAAAEVEARLRGSGRRALLSGGSAYADNYNSAAEAHFCAPSLGWGQALRSARPVVQLFFVLSNLFGVIRTLLLLILESVLALTDFVRGSLQGYGLSQELKFIPARVAICILLRELSVMGAKMDISRGLAVIHINFLGYDEQAHRRGPGSLFAHWTLKGIDNAIARLWRSAQRAPLRQYDLWVYSDHGQASVKGYQELYGISVTDAVNVVFATNGKDAAANRNIRPQSIQAQRVGLLGSQWLKLQGQSHSPVLEQPLSVVALGPLGLVYTPPSLSAAEKARLAVDLVEQARIPLVVFNEQGRLKAVTSDGCWSLPDDLDKVLGAHPYRRSVGEDLLRLSRHQDCGDLILLGWRQGVEAISFAAEHGGHGGLSVPETSAFMLLPADVPLPERSVLRAVDLRRAAFRHLSGRPQSANVSEKGHRPAGHVRVMTYNIHGCVGMDGILDPGRIARLVARYQPDLVALQELDVNRKRSGSLDQAQLIARHLKMHFHFHPSFELEEGAYGNAILSRLPMQLVRAAALPTLAGRQLEPRGALWVSVQAGSGEIQLINTHLGLNGRERLLQTEALLSEDWLGDCSGPVVLCGDFNAFPRSKVWKRLTSSLRDVQVEADNHKPRGTYSGLYPKARIDHLFIGTGLEVASVRVPAGEMARMASDHLPLICDIRFSLPSLTG